MVLVGCQSLQTAYEDEVCLSETQFRPERSSMSLFQLLRRRGAFGMRHNFAMCTGTRRSLERDATRRCEHAVHTPKMVVVASDSHECWNSTRVIIPLTRRMRSCMLLWQAGELARVADVHIAMASRRVLGIADDESEIERR